jgi:flagellar hook assembly protein FlgD
MDVISDVTDGQLKVLVYSLGANRIQSGENAILAIEYDGELELVSHELVDYYGNDLTVTVKDVTLPVEFSVSQNFPNPFNPETVISLSLPHASDWTITIYNIAGQIVKTLYGYSDAGTVTARWQGNDESGQEVASGIYLYKVSVGDYSVTKKMLLLK